jgi:hypothetical protein
MKLIPKGRPIVLPENLAVVDPIAVRKAVTGGSTELKQILQATARKRRL